MDADFLDMLPHTVTHEVPDGTYTDRGQPNFGASTSYSCYIDPIRGEEIVRLAGGEEAKASYRIYLNATARLNPEGRLTLPAGYVPQQPLILAQALVADEVGAHHVEILV